MNIYTHQTNHHAIVRESERVCLFSKAQNIDFSECMQHNEDNSIIYKTLFDDKAKVFENQFSEMMHRMQNFVYISLSPPSHSLTHSTFLHFLSISPSLSLSSSSNFLHMNKFRSKYWHDDDTTLPLSTNGTYLYLSIRIFPSVFNLIEFLVSQALNFSYSTHILLLFFHKNSQKKKRVQTSFKLL